MTMNKKYTAALALRPIRDALIRHESISGIGKIFGYKFYIQLVVTSKVKKSLLSKRKKND